MAMSGDEKTPRSVGRVPSNRSLGAHRDFKPLPDETKAIERLTRELVKRGDFRIRFFERLEEKDYPTLLVFIALPREIHSGDAEILQLHEVANQISDSGSIDVMITVSAISGPSRRLEYESAEIAMNIASEVLSDLPNLFSSANLLQSAMKMSAGSGLSGRFEDLSKNLLSLAEVFFYLGYRSESMKTLDMLAQLLGRFPPHSIQRGDLDFSHAFFEINEVPHLYAQFQEFERGYSIIDQNFERLRT